MIDITGNNQWISIPNDKGEFGEPFFLEKGATCTTNYDEIKILKKLETDTIDLPTEKVVYQELAKPVNVVRLTPEAAVKVLEKAPELGIILTKTIKTNLTTLINEKSTF